MPAEQETPWPPKQPDDPVRDLLLEEIRLLRAELVEWKAETVKSEKLVGQYREIAEAAQQVIQQIADGGNCYFCTDLAKDHLERTEGPSERNVADYDPRTMRCKHGGSITCPETNKGAAWCWAERTKESGDVD